MPTQWDVARTANTMGVVTTVHIDPTKISKIIKNKLIKWLDSGFLEGGCRSQARKLGELLVAKYDLNVSTAGWRSVTVHQPSPELCNKLTELLDADWAAWVMDNPYYRDGYYADEHRKTKAYLQARHAKVSLHFFDTVMRDKAVELVREHRTDTYEDRVRKAIDALNGTELIQVMNYGG